MVVKSIDFFFKNFQNKKIDLPENIELSEMKLTDLGKRDLINNSEIYRILLII